jgi:hypothetical protein
MKFRQTSFWRNYVKLYLQYMAVGVAAIPAGILYAFAVSRGYESRWLTLIILVVGGCCARWAWTFADRKLTAPELDTSMIGQTDLPSTNMVINIIWETQAGDAGLWEAPLIGNVFMDESNKAALRSLPVIDLQSTNGSAGEPYAAAGI